MMRVCLIILAGLLVLTAPSFLSGLPAGEEAAPPNFSLEVEEGKVTLRARDADLEEILEELSRRAGFELFIYEDIKDKVTAEFNGVELESLLEKLLPNYGFLYRTGQGGGLVLRAVAVVRSRGDMGEEMARRHIGRVAYGDQPGEIGRVNTPGVERQGPKSFAVSGAGDIYLCDTINGRIQIYGPDGKLKRSIASGGRPSDIAVSESGEIFLLDEEQGLILRYGKKGARLADIPVPRSLLAAGESLRTFGGSLLLRTRDGDEYEIVPGGDGKEGSVSGPLRGSRLTPSSSCLVRKVSGREGEVTIIGPGGEVLDTIPVPVDRLVSIVFLGRDKEMNLYLQVEQFRPDGPDVDLGVIQLNSAGILLNRIEKIPNPYANWTVRLLQVNGKGDIYQMLPGPEAVELNRWSCTPVPKKGD
jgi:hypothetical protein